MDLSHYSISGLSVTSDVVFPSASLAPEASAPPDVVIGRGAVPPSLHLSEEGQRTWEADSGRFLLKIAPVGRFLIASGESITYTLNAGVSARDAAPFLLGTCFAILLQQRGSLVLHASAVATANGAKLFCGSSGAGKSTLAALLCRRGYDLVNDDVCSLTEGDAAGKFFVKPDGRMLKLWGSSLQHLHWQPEPEMAVQDGMDKFFIAPPHHRAARCPVSSIYILRDAPLSETPSVQALSPLEGVAELMSNSYRPELLSPMKLRERYFQACVSLTRSVGVFALSRPKDFSSAEMLMDTLETHWHHNS